MRDVMTDVKAWLEQGDPVALATVISTWGSAPRPAGSRMAISQSGKISGSVSGGCLEGEVFEQAQAILQGKPASLFHYGVSDDLAWTVGLSCGGEIDVLIEPLAPVHRELIRALEAEHPVVLKTDVGEKPGARQLLTPADPDVPNLLDRENPVRQDGVFLEPFPRPPELFRSEEHTSELQSRLHLVCRLLLEKKKNKGSATRRNQEQDDSRTQRRPSCRN